MSLRIQPAGENDVPLILEFIRDLAVYENLLEYFQATEEGIRSAVFGPNAVAHVLIAHDGDKPVGFALYYYTFSTFPGQKGIYLEDLFVKPEARSRGIGRALLAELARRAKEENCCRIEWAVLHWNENAIRFYQGLGAVPMNEWAVYRLSGEALERLAS